jgi:tRNA(Arg) A34 adenosine deaminase TadA
MSITIEKHINNLWFIARDLEPVNRSYRLAAAIIYKGKIISYGYSQYKTHPAMIKYGRNGESIFLHAEVDAINKAKKRISEHELKKATLIVVRHKLEENGKKHEMFGTSKPCSGCAQCIKEHGIKRVVYTENSFFDKLKYITENM